MKKFIYIALAVCVIMGCKYIINEHPSADDMYVKSAALKKLSAAVESAVQYKDAPPQLENEQLLKFATEHNPKLLDGFSPYTLKAININQHSIVLMCDVEGKHALIEDSGCTGEIDAQHWQSAGLPPCEFTLQLEAICN